MRVHTTAEGWDFEPAWSPDGTKIAFLRSPHFAGGRLHVIDVTTSEKSICLTRFMATARCGGIRMVERFWGCSNRKRRVGLVGWI